MDVIIDHRDKRRKVLVFRDEKLEIDEDDYRVMDKIVRDCDCLSKAMGDNDDNDDDEY